MPIRRRGARVGGKVEAAPRPRPIERRVAKFAREPASIRTAAGVIVAVTAVVVVGSGIVFRLVDHEEYHSIWAGMWLALQTITTVGYGDVAPKETAGRLVAALLMLNGIAFLAIVTAAITSTFVARATRVGLATDEDASRADTSRVDARLDELARQLTQLQSTLDRLAEPPRDRSAD